MLIKMFSRFAVVIRRFSGPGIKFVVSRNQRPQVIALSIVTNYITNQVFYLSEEQLSVFLPAQLRPK